MRIGSHSLTNEQFARLLNFDDTYKNPTSFRFDVKRNLLFFLCNQRENNILTIHYLDLGSDKKEIKTLLNYRQSKDDLSIEAVLQRERQRVMTSGITSYKYFEARGVFLVDMNSKIHLIDISESLETPKVQEVPGSTYNMALTSDFKMVTYVKEGNVWATCIASGKAHQLTRSEGKLVKSGDAAFVYAEEFSRYTGYWVSPTVSASGSYAMLYIEEDESQVMEYGIPNGEINGVVDQYRYPLAGKDNSRVQLKVLEFSCDGSVARDLAIDIHRYCQWFEYIVRAGWTPNGKYMWVQVLDRAQGRLEILQFSLADPTRQPDILHQEVSNAWINVTDLLYFCKNSNHFLVTSEVSGFRHLYLVGWKDEQSFDRLSVTQLTSGDWMIKDAGLWVCEEKQIVAFVGTKDSPLQSHLYTVSYSAGAGSPVTRLTKEGFFHTQISVASDFSQFISSYSNLTTPAQIDIVRGGAVAHTLPNLNPANIAYTLDGIATHKDIFYYETLAKSRQELFSFTNSKGVTLHGKVLFPADYDPSKAYPTVLAIYGGPHVQLVTEQYSMIKHFFTYFGFICVIIDNMGSANRGVKFEAELKWKMGAIEINDYVEGLEHLIKTKTASIDRARIAIHGWSYGGYLALMGIGQRPDFFKIAISGAPVTLWEAYNTGYTERYMSTPQLNPDGYNKANTLTYVPKFPTEDDRLILIHGVADENVHFSNTAVLVEELTKNQKPYILKILTKERHSVRSVMARTYIESHNLNHLLKHL